MTLKGSCLQKSGSFLFMNLGTGFIEIYLFLFIRLQVYDDYASGICYIYSFAHMIYLNRRKKSLNSS